MPSGVYTRTEETRKIISKAKTGRGNNWLGKKHTPETLKKISEAGKRRKHSDESRKKMSEAKIGKKLSEAHKRKIGEAQKGEKHHWYRGGVTTINAKIRHSFEYKLWRTAVFLRDNYTCVWCGEKGGILNADHIKPFAHYPELRFSIDNGRTLCVSCHRTTDTFGHLSKNHIKYGG